MTTHFSPPSDVARKLAPLAADAPTSLHALGNVDLLHAHPTLALLSAFPDYVRRATVETAYARNRFVAALADGVFIAHAPPGSKTAQLAWEVETWGRKENGE